MGFDMQAVNDTTAAGYHHLNIWGMALVCQEMNTVGLLNYTPHTPWQQDMNEEEVRAVLAQRAPVVTQVPAFKFCSNDGWLVTPEECSLIAQRLRTSKDVLAQGFANYCAQCVTLGGFEVW